MTACKELEGLFLAIKEDVKDEITWAALADYGEEHVGERLDRFDHGYAEWLYVVRRTRCDGSVTGSCLFARARVLICLFAMHAPTREGGQRCEEVQLYDGYADSEPDTDNYIAVGDWNAIGKYFEGADNSPGELANALEQLGFTLEWSDQVADCDECGKVIRTEPDCFSWQARYTLGDGEIVCHVCQPLTPSEDSLEEDELSNEDE